jgi:hypothetical protein
MGMLRLSVMKRAVFKAAVGVGKGDQHGGHAEPHNAGSHKIPFSRMLYEHAM